ncbi:MAG: DUF4911 domain-containing protein [bacterium]
MRDKARYFMLPPEEIAYVGFVIHAYEGLGVVRTLDGKMGLVEILLSPHMEEELEELIRALAKEVPIRELSRQEVISLKEVGDLCPF